MKKKLVFLFVLMFSAAMIFAQEDKSNYNYTAGNCTYKNVKIQKVWQCKDGYVINYYKTNGEVATLFAAKSWFSYANKKASLVKLPKDLPPYMTIILNNNEPVLFWLHMPVPPSHAAWGIVPKSFDTTGKFSENSIPKIEY